MTQAGWEFIQNPVKNLGSGLNACVMKEVHRMNDGATPKLTMSAKLSS